MHADERARVQGLLDEMGRLNDRLNVLHRAAVQELARTRRLLTTQQDVVELVGRDHPDSPQAAVVLAQFLLERGELEPAQRELALGIVRAGDETVELARQLVADLTGR